MFEGSDVSAPFDDFAAAWTSPDGITWARVPHDDAVFGSSGEAEDLRMYDVEYGNGVFTVTDGDRDSDGDVVVWVAE